MVALLAGTALYLWLAHALGAVVACIAATAGAGGFYALDVWWHPERECWACKGSRRHASSITKAFGACIVCKGSGVRPRMAVRLLNRGQAAAIRRGEHGKHF